MENNSVKLGGDNKRGWRRENKSKWLKKKKTKKKKGQEEEIKEAGA